MEIHMLYKLCRERSYTKFPVENILKNIILLCGGGFEDTMADTLSQVSP
jgi:hypothetical protein